jgi:hypothetical protein
LPKPTANDITSVDRADQISERIVRSFVGRSLCNEANLLFRRVQMITACFLCGKYVLHMSLPFDGGVDVGGALGRVSKFG